MRAFVFCAHHLCDWLRRRQLRPALRARITTSPRSPRLTLRYPASSLRRRYAFCRGTHPSSLTSSLSPRGLSLCLDPPRTPRRLTPSHKGRWRDRVGRVALLCHPRNPLLSAPSPSDVSSTSLTSSAMRLRWVTSAGPPDIYKVDLRRDAPRRFPLPPILFP